jgi:hypothetical protein
MGEVLWVSIEAAGIGRVRQIADTMEQVRRLAGNQHDGPSRAKAHDFIGRQQRAALQMLPGAAGRAARLRIGGGRVRILWRAREAIICS